MGARTKLPVLDVLGEAVRLTLRRIPSILKVFISTALVILLPTMLLISYIIGDDLFVSTATGSEDLWPLFLAFCIMFAAVILFYGMIATSLVRMVVLGEKVRLINFNRYVWANIGSQIVYVLMVLTIAVYILLGLAAFAVERPDETVLLQGVIGGCFFFFLLQFTLSIRMSLFAPDASVGGVIRPWRSFRMTRSSFWKLLGLLLLAGLVTWAATNLDDGLAPLFAILPVLDAPIWSVPEGSVVSDTFVADLLHFVLQNPAWIVLFAITLAVQAFLIGFPYILSGLIYLKLSDGKYTA